jgi:hypothetical protein
MRISRKNRAFMLHELLFVLGMLAVAALVASRLFTASMLSIDNARTVEDRQLTMDRLSATLRHDVWAATKIEMPNPQTLAISQPNDKSVHWRFENDGIARVDAKDEIRWPIGGIDARFDNASIELHSKASDQTWHFISPTLMAAGGPSQ